jgi:protease-4
VGSIGVVGGKVAVGQALERFGVHAETFTGQPGNAAAASRAAYLSPLVAWDEPTKARVLESMTGIYDLFLARVSEGRSTMGRVIGVDKIAPNAEGRIFTGVQGKERGLVDEIGGLHDAIAKARELAKLPADAEVAVVGQKPGFLDALEGSGGGQDSEERAGVASPAAAVKDARDALGPRPIDALERIAPDLVPFVTSLSPIESGERALCAVPYAIVLR